MTSVSLFVLHRGHSTHSNIVLTKYNEVGFVQTHLDNKDNLFSALNSTLNNTSSSGIALLLNTKPKAIPGLPSFLCSQEVLTVPKLSI